MSVTLDGSVLVIQFDDGKANAVSHAFVDEMNEGLDRAQADAQAVVITGRPGMFSAGFDLKELAKGADAATALVGRGARMLLRIFSHPQPVVAAVSGHAVAAGAFMCLASDTRYAAAGEFQFGLNETAIGMSLPVFGFQLAQARLSKRHLTQAVTQATMYSVDQAKDVGFVDEVLPADDVLATAVREAARLGEFETPVYHANKVGWRQPYIDAIEASLR